VIIFYWTLVGYAAVQIIGCLVSLGRGKKVVVDISTIAVQAVIWVGILIGLLFLEVK